MKFKFYRIRVWNPENSSIKTKFTFKSELLVGSDSKSELRFKNLEPLAARLDLLSGEVFYLPEGRLEKIDSTRLFQIGPHFFQYRSYDLTLRRLHWVYGISVLLLLCATYLSCDRPGDRQDLCLPAIQALKEGRALDFRLQDQKSQEFVKEFNPYRQALRTAIQERNFIKARVELESLESILKSYETKTCPLAPLIQKFSYEFYKPLISFLIKEGDLKAAIDEFRRLEDASSLEQTELMKRRLLRLIRKKYLEAYALEDTNAEKAGDLMDLVIEACQSLGEEDRCYRQSSSVSAKSKSKEVGGS